MAALRALPCRDCETLTPFIAPDERRPYEPIDPVERWLDLDDGRFDCIVNGIPMKIILNLHKFHAVYD